MDDTANGRANNSIVFKILVVILALNIRATYKISFLIICIQNRKNPKGFAMSSWYKFFYATKVLLYFSGFSEQCTIKEVNMNEIGMRLVGFLFTLCIEEKVIMNFFSFSQEMYEVTGHSQSISITGIALPENIL